MLQVGRNVGILAAALFVFSFAMAFGSPARKADRLVCDVAADNALAVQDYPTAMDLHRKLLRSAKNNALAHYHLGFAYGMVGDVSEEISEYRTAVGLGLNVWDLFLNLGLAYYDQHDLPAATAALETAVLFGPKHAETHFNLALVYERENRLPEALHEIKMAIVLEPADLDASNTEAVVCARMGNLARARGVWMRLLRTAPDYLPARNNLAILGRSCGGHCTSFSDSPPTEPLSEPVSERLPRYP